jgi:hypothetical protein
MNAEDTDEHSMTLPLTVTHPELAAQADGWDPTQLRAGSGKTVNWKCAHNHQWSARVYSRVKGNKCPICGNKQVLVGYNDLATTNPELAKEADGWDPTTLTAGSSKKVGWKCNKGHSWLTAITHRTLNRSGCPICSGNQVLVGYNDLATTNPELAKEADGWDPTTLTAGSNKKVGWKCNKGHSWCCGPKQRKRSGCPICGNKQVLVGYNDLATTNPELAKEADGWDPTTLTVKSGIKVGWKCTQGHRWDATLAHRSNGTNCPICSGNQVLVGYNDLATTNPELAKEADGWDPTTLTVKSGIKVGWKCTQGHRWTSAVGSRAIGSSCLICGNKQVLVGYNDLATTNPELAKEADGWDPTTLTAGSNKKVGWKCNKGHSWKTSVISRTVTGCPSCAKFGFDPNLNGFLYLIDNFDLHMFQIGITNFPDKRLDRHGRSGWEVIELRGPMDGQLTRQLETNCLHALEKRGAILGHKAGIDKFDGYSEAWTKASLNVTSIKQILDWVYGDEGLSND